VVSKKPGSLKSVDDPPAEMIVTETGGKKAESKKDKKKKGKKDKQPP
jgi:hypothetical protein